MEFKKLFGQKIKRRSFLTALGVAGAAGVIGSRLNGYAQAEEAEGDPYNPEPIGRYHESQWIATGCAGCTSWCSLEANALDGRVIKMRGNANSKVNAGAMCARGHLAIQQLYDPDRLKVPMKRTNPLKGRDQDPMFVPISWDEAMDTLADRIMELRAAQETHKLAVFRGRYTQMNQIIYGRVPAILGSPNNISHSSICAEAEKFGPYYTEGYWNYRDYDLANTKYVICWGVDPINSNRQVSLNNKVWGELLDRAQIAVVDPGFSATAAKSDEWLPVNPGTDGALAVAMAHVILTEGLWSREFVGEFKDGSNGFIAGQTVDPDNFAERETNGVVSWWNLELKDRTPEWAAGETGVPAEQIARVARDFANAAPHALVFMGGGAVMQVRGAYNSMAVHGLNGLVGSVDNVGGTIRGASVAHANLPDNAPFIDPVADEGRQYPKIDQRGTKEFPALNSGRSGGGVVTNRVADAVLAEDPYDLKVIIAYWCNFNFSCPETDRWDKAMEKVPFLAHVVTNYSEMSHYADLLLPSTHHSFEQYGYLAQKGNTYTHVWLGQPVIKPFWDVKNAETDMMWLLAEKLAAKGFENLLAYFRTFEDPETGAAPTNGKEFEEYGVKIRLRPIWDPEQYRSGDRFESWQHFKDVGVWNSASYDFKAKWGNFDTVTKKFEFYSETLKAALQQHADRHNASIDEIMETCKYTARGELAFIPHYEEPYIWGDPSEYPLVLIDRKSKYSREGRSANTSWFQEVKDADPGDVKWDDVIKLHPQDAARFGIADYDTVRVTSPVGEIVCKARIWEAVPPGTANKTFGQGHWAFGRVAAQDFDKKIPRGGNNNTIMPADFERLSGSTAFYGYARIKVTKLEA